MSIEAFRRRRDKDRIQAAMNNISNLGEIQRSGDQKPIQKTYFHKFHKILPALKFAECKIWIRGSWRLLHIITKFCKNNYYKVLHKQLNHFGKLYHTITCGGVNKAVDINLPWNEASDRLMHIGMWIRIVGQLYKSTQPNRAHTPFSLAKCWKSLTIDVLLFPKSVHCARFEWKTVWIII